jgi:hypothetical protein
VPFLILKDVSCTNVNGDSVLHQQGTVVSDWEVSDKIKAKIKDGSLHYRTLFEPLTEKEALDHRAKETAVEGDRMVDGQWVSPPWPDYVGLHPEEIVDRLKKSADRDEVAQVRLYERGGLSRAGILDYVAPVEREPFYGYDELPVRSVLEKLEVLSDEAVGEVLTYESAHRRRPAIISYERSDSENESGEGHEDAESKTTEEVMA